MADTPTYKELAQQVQNLTDTLHELQTQYIWIRREPATSAPGSLDVGTGVLSNTGSAWMLHIGFNEGVKSATLS